MAMNVWQAGMVASVVALVRQFAWFKSALDCARQLHDRLLEAVIRAPMSFFYATPTGRIVTRFSKDQGTVDSEIPDMVSDFFLCLFSSVATLAVICGVLPWFLVPVVPVMAVYWWVMQNYRKASRGTTTTALPALSECQRTDNTPHRSRTRTRTHMHVHTELGRLESLTSAPIYAHYSETLEGLDTIRAFGFQHLLKKENEGLLMTNLRAYFCYSTSHRYTPTHTILCTTTMLLTLQITIFLWLCALSVGCLCEWTRSGRQSWWPPAC